MNDLEIMRIKLLEETNECKACRFCCEACGTFNVSDNLETLSAYGRIQTLRYLLLGFTELDDSATYSLYSCMKCRKCEVICKSMGGNLDITSILSRGRALLAGKLIEEKNHERF